MARLFSSGFELNTNGTIEMQPVNGFSDNGTIVTTTVRSGTYSLRINPLTSGNASGMGHQFAAAAGNGAYFFRAYFRFATFPSAENVIMGLFSSSNMSAAGANISIDNTGVLKLRSSLGGTQIGSSSSALSTGTWYRIEIQYDRTPANGSQIINANLDGTQFAGASNLTITSQVDYLAVGGNLNLEAQTTGDWFIDDMALNDSTGSFQNTYPGAGSIIHLRPNAAGDNNLWTWTGHSASTNYQATNEVTPDDATNFINSSLANDIDDYNIDATPAALDSNATINVVQIGERSALQTGTSTHGIKVRVKASSGGTVEESAQITVNSTTWNTNANATPFNYSLTLYDLPGASTTAWTKTDLDNAQIGVNHSTQGSFSVRTTALWMLVDYTPSGVASSGDTLWPKQGSGYFWGPIA